jgi:hypothetical protein
VSCQVDNRSFLALIIAQERWVGNYDFIKHQPFGPLTGRPEPGPLISSFNRA